MLQLPDRRYRLGHSYRDSGASSDPSDQFLRWVNQDGSGIRNMGGIRPLKYIERWSDAPAWIILVTHEGNRGTHANPWEDLVDLAHGRIVYWGDAKFDPARAIDDFVGNKALRLAWEAVIDNRAAAIPPILHFTKAGKGTTRFNGLCVIDRLDFTWFEDHGRPVRNYRAQLTVLDEHEVDLRWLQARARATSLAELEATSRQAPAAWRRYEAGAVDRLRIWASMIRSTEAQLPERGSPDEAVLQQLAAMPPTQFEAAVVALLREMDEVRHTIHRTRPTADGGFDFYGSFTLPPPLDYEISLLGEAKRYATTTAVSPDRVSRLVARLNRGQYGLFVTTSYYTKQAQEEVVADGYPVKLISGSDVTRMMREMRITQGSTISPRWLDAVTTELATPIGSPVTRAAEPTPAWE